MATSTRKTSVIWLVGAEEARITGSKLPSNKQALSVFFYHHRTLLKTVHESAVLVVKEVVSFWNKARIPVRPQHHAVKQLESLFETWQKLKKNSKRTSQTQTANESHFTDSLDDLLDIAHQDAMCLIKIQEDKDFLLAQREKGRRGCMGSVDKSLTLKEGRFQRKKLGETSRGFQSELEKCKMSETAQWSFSESSDEAPEGEPKPSTSSQPRKRARKNILNPDLAAAMDRTKVSDRNATFLLTAAAESLGHNADDLTINRSSIRRSRQKLRQEQATNLKDEFESKGPLVVHWDGKLLVDLTGKELVDRLPVIVTGNETNQLLGVPKLLSGTGEQQATAVAHLVREWGVTDSVKAMCFDTTASNTGIENGACVLLEKKLNKNLLHLACRHHILELVLGCVFKECMGPTSGPDVLLFKRFQKVWSTLDHTVYITVGDDQVLRNAVVGIQAEIIAFAAEHLQEKQPRDDYRELLELTIIFLGGTPSRGVHFLAPGAIHHARWMAKALYAFKIYMFSTQFKLTKREKKGLGNVCLFLVRCYVTAWYDATSAVSAPLNDLALLRNLSRFQEVDAAISKAALKKFGGHMWYISEELVGLAFFDSRISIEDKRAMVTSLREKEGSAKPLKRIVVDLSKSDQLSLQDFITKSTTVFFSNLGICMGFMDLDPEAWCDCENYKEARLIVTNLKVVNDHAERGVALMESYNSLITKDEEQKQFLLRVVQEHRRQFPDCKKATLNKTN